MGVPVDSVRLSGGGAASPFWRQMLADVFGKRAAILETQEGSAYGAALLAMVGTGAFGSIRDLCREATREVESIEPRPHEAQFYTERHRVYQSLYPALFGFYHAAN
jgi:xylulokinase